MIFMLVFTLAFTPLFLTLAARQEKESFWTKRRLRILLSGRIEFVGGPLDGLSQRVSRLAATGLDPRVTWPIVNYYGGGNYRVEGHLRARRYNFDQLSARGGVWAGTYEARCMADAMHWDGTGFESWIDEDAISA